MDQQQLSTMDPKLREAYDRIMGNTPQPVVQTATPPQAVQTPTSSPQSNQAPQVTPQPASIPTAPNGFEPQSQDNQTQNTPPSVSQNPPIQNHIDSMPPTSPPPTPNTQPIQAVSTPQPFMDPVIADNQMHAYVAAEVAGVKQSLKIIQLMYIVGGIVFFAVYALFWMKFFNIPSPF